ncbi:nitronate monooxygenase [Streptomyces sp. NPDC096311]|uniref:nitronate monooxygenase n=1 Tax=Streptomyces sp. NPDC096311 TaxID=3366083 RepID=UPI0038002D47
MKTPICDMLGIDLPLLAFSHCRDVVAAVTNAGGFGVLGASSHTPEDLEHELAWIDEQVDGKPYGADLVIPEKFEGKGQRLTAEELAARVPTGHHAFVDGLLKEHGLETGGRDRWPAMANVPADGIGEKLLDVALRHPIKLIANALGVPPRYMIDRAKEAGVPVAALVGAKEHAIKQVRAGVDVLIAQGTEAGGHCGEVTTMVLVPEVVEAIRPIREVPVLAAGGIVTGRQMAAAVALGAAGVWTGSVWLTTEEADTAPYTVQKMLAASSRDTVRSKGRTGKSCRQLKSAWTDAWERPGNPEPLPMPLQSLVSERALRYVDMQAEKGNPGARELATYFVGQGVGLIDRVRSTRDVVYGMAEDFAEAAERLADAMGE